MSVSTECTAALLSFRYPNSTLTKRDGVNFLHSKYYKNNSYLRVSMGLTDGRKTGKNLVDGRKNCISKTHQPREIMRPTDKAKRLTVVPYSPSLPLKTLEMGILLLAVFTLELETDYRSETRLCTVAPLPDRHPLSDFFSEGKGRLYKGYLQ